MIRGKKMIQIDVSGDGSCLLHSIALAYLLPVVDNETAFKECFGKVFGDDQIPNLKKIETDLFIIEKDSNNPNSGIPFACISSDKNWRALIQIFRHRLVKLMKEHTSHYDSFFASYHPEDYNSGSYDKYLAKIWEYPTHLGDLEVCAASDFLHYPIKVKDQSSYNEDFPGIPLELYYVNGNHYNFGLDKGLYRCFIQRPTLSLMERGAEVSPNNPDLEPAEEFNEIESMEVQSDDSYSSGEKRCIKRNLFNAIEENDFEETNKIIGNFRGDPKLLINAQDANDDNNTPLHMAVKKRSKKKTNKKASKEIIDLLINRGADVNIGNRKGETPLCLVPEESDWQSIKSLLLANQEGTSGQGSSTSKRRTPSDNVGSTLALTAYESRDGGKPSYRGFVYQLKLLILVSKRAIERKYNFQLATEMDAAEKFDDIVFQYYHEEEKKWFWQYLQIKHKENVEKKKITVTCLTSEEGEINRNAFTLHKYFISFLKIENNKLFKTQNSNQRIDSKNFDICTNTGFHSKLLDDKDWKNFISDEKDLEKGEIVYLGKGEKIRQFKNDSQTIDGITEKLKPGLISEEFIRNKNTLDTVISNVIKSSEGINENSDNKSIIKAGKEVQMFLKGWLLEEAEFENLNQAIEEFKKIGKHSDSSLFNLKKTKAIEEYHKIIEEVKKCLSGDKISRSVPRKLEVIIKRIQEILDAILKADEYQKLKEIKKINTNNFTKDEILKNYTNEAREILSKTPSSNKVIDKLKRAVLVLESEKEILKVVLDEKELKKKVAQFLEKFRFIVQYPGVDELDDLIKDEFKNGGLGTEVFSLNSDLVYASFEMNMSEWFKYYKKGRGEFLSAQEGAEFLKSIQKEINGLMIVGLSEAYFEKLTDYGISFRENPKTLKDFLSLEGKLNNKQIFHLSTESTLLSAIKVRQSLKGFDKYRNHDGVIFMNLTTLLRQETQKYALEAFSSDRTHHLLVIECQSKTQEKTSKIQQLYKKLSETLKNRDKKVILIAKGEDIFAKEFSRGSYQNKYQKQTDLTLFEDLNEDSQDKVLEKEVNFQGRTVKLNRLIDKNLASDIIDQASLSKLIGQEKIKLGNEKAFFSIGYVRDYNISRTLHRQHDIDKNNVIKEEDFSKPEALKQKVVILVNDSGEGKSTVLTSIANQMREVDDNKKDRSDLLWIVRINLNDYAVDKEKPQSLHNIKFIENEIEKAIKFVSEMIVPDDSKDTDIELQRKLFKAGLETQNPKIVILFDGFDEISPSYKPNTTKLIKALKMSKVTQLWVTTRVHEGSHLERELASPVHILNPFTRAEQEEFLGRFWRWSLKFSKYPHNQEIRQKTYEEIRRHLEESQKTFKQLANQTSTKGLDDKISELLKHHQQLQVTGQLDSLKEAIDERDKNGQYKLDFSTYAKILLDQWKASIIDKEKTFTSVPLNLRMLAEVVFEMNFQIPGDLGLSDLYDKFVEVKFDILRKEKATGSDNPTVNSSLEGRLRASRRVHHELALKLYLREEWEKMLLPGLNELSRFNADYEKDGKGEEVVRVGLLTLRGDHLEFIHRSFAEYFLSEYLILNLKNEQVQTFLLEKVLLTAFNTLVCKFFNSQLEKNPLADITLTAAVRESITKRLENNDHQYIVLHLMAHQGHTAIIIFLLEKFKQLHIAENLVLICDICGGTALHKATLHSTSKTLEALLEWVKVHLREDTVEKLILKGDNNGKTVLNLAALWNRIGTLKALLKWVKNNLREDILDKLLLKSDKSGETALHSAAHWGRSGTLRTLLKWVNDNLGKDTVEKLVFRGAMNGETALHLATFWDWREHLKTVDKFLEVDFGEDDLEKLGNQNQYSIEKGYELQITMEWVNSYLEENTIKELVLKYEKNIQTSLQYVASIDESEALKALLEWVKVNLGEDACKTLVLISNKNGATALHYAACAFDDSKTLKALLEWVKVNLGQATCEKLVLIGEKSGYTILHYVASMDKSKNLNALLGWITENLGEDTIEKLIVKDVKDGGTALHLAALSSKSETVVTLIEWMKVNLGEDIFKALVLKSSNLALTALHLAALRGHTETVNALLDKVKEHLGRKVFKALLSASDKDGKTALDLAIDKGHQSVVYLLMKFYDENGLFPLEFGFKYCRF